MSNVNAETTPIPTPEINTYGLTDLGYKIFLDRYALKDLDRKSLNVGDVVIAVLNDTSDMNGKREISVITEINADDTVSIVTQAGKPLTIRAEYIDKPLEVDPAQMHKRVARGLASVENDDKKAEWTEKFEWLMNDWKFIPGGRILAMAGSEHNLTGFNCFVIDLPGDSRAGIIKTLSEMAEIMSRGGGVGINVSSLRPKNAYVKGVNGRSSGAVSFGALYSFMTGLISQSGSRRGALMLILNDYHPDVLNFIDSKKKAGQITNANISVGISDRFMEAVKNDGDWDLVFPDTQYENYDTEWDGNMDKWMAENKPFIKYQTIKARDMWNKIIESAWSSAEPGLWFRERANKMSNSYYYDQGHIIATNPCVTGDTIINTSIGMKTMEELYNTQAEFQVVVDGRFGTETLQKSSKVFVTGVKPVYRLTTSDGYTLKATGNHEIMTSEGWKPLETLKIGDKVHTLNRKGSFGETGDLKLGRTIGWLVGDGHFSSDRAFLSFYGEEKEELAPIFAGYVNEIANNETSLGYRQNYAVGISEQPTHDRRVVGSVRLERIMESYGLRENKLQVPEAVLNGTEDMQRGYLQGLFSADGSIQGNLEKGISIRLTSVSLNLLNQVQLLLANFGIKSKLYAYRRLAGMRSMPNGQGGSQDYECQATHELMISKSNVETFADEIRFIHTKKNNKMDELIASKKRVSNHETFTSSVESIVLLGEETVYDLTQPTTHSFIANGIVVHNCAEQSLPANAVCNLGAVNLGKFSLNEVLPYNEVSFDDAVKAVNWDDLAQAVQYAVRFLDNVIDHTYYVSEENKIQEEGERRIGLGIMGLAELMIRSGIKYGSEDSIKFIDTVMHFIARNSYIASSNIAAEKGSFGWFEAEPFLNSGFMQGMDEDVKELIRSQGMRNVTLNTIAPTGTTSTMIDTSGGIEPYFSFVFFRQGRLGVHEQRVGLASQWLDQHKTDKLPSFLESSDAESKDYSGQALPSFFITAMDLTPNEHVMTMAAAQRWIDSSISKTCNVPNEYTLEQTQELYMYMYDMNCKGGTIYRDGSRNEQVLHLENPETKTEAKSVEVSITPTVEPVLPTIAAAPQPEQGFSLSNKKRPSLLKGVTFQVATPYATNAYVTVNEDENRYPYEVFITVGKAGSDLQAQAESIGRLVSKSIQIMPPSLRYEGLRAIMEQLVGIGGNSSSGFGPNQVRSLPDAISNAVMRMYFGKRDIDMESYSPENGHEAENVFELPKLNLQSSTSTITSTAAVGTTIYLSTTASEVAPTIGAGANVGVAASTNGKNAYNNNTRPAVKAIKKNSMTEICPDCHNYSLVREEGCKHCYNCGHSQC